MIGRIFKKNVFFCLYVWEEMGCRKYIKIVMVYIYGLRRVCNEKSCNLYIIRVVGDINFLKFKINERVVKVINFISRELVNFKVIIFLV